MTDEKTSIFFRLRRLQEQNRSDIPGMMMQKNMNAFTLHQDAAPEPLPNTVSVVVHPQDPFVSEPAVRDAGPKGRNASFCISRLNSGKARPTTLSSGPAR